MFNQRIAQDVTSTQADAEKASYEAQARFGTSVLLRVIICLYVYAHAQIH